MKDGLCECGCGKRPNEGKRFLRGHSVRTRGYAKELLGCSCVRLRKMLTENKRLREASERLQFENETLQKMLEKWDERMVDRGAWAEAIVTDLTGGTRNSHGKSFDVLSKSGHRFEVKFSGIHRSESKGDTRKWVWHKVLRPGIAYDVLILIGIKDPRFYEKYPVSGFPYLMFAIPYEDVGLLFTNGEKHYSISISTNPDLAFNAKSKAQILYKKYRVTPSQIERKYKTLKKYPTSRGETNDEFCDLSQSGQSESKLGSLPVQM